MQSRREVCGVLLMGQRLTIEPDAGARRALRVARAYPIEFGFPTGAVSSITHDISTTGLSAIVADSPSSGEVLSMRLKIGGGTVIRGRCQVVKIIPKQGSTRMAVAFEGLPADAHERIETIVCDVVVSELASSLRPRRAVED